ncbi:MAG TPA: flagellar hook protein FlgE [Acetobacteraceae bacterium]
MSLFGAMSTAISGLSAQSAAFGNIGDNVANSQTIGFKRVDTSFEDYLTSSTATSNQSGSVVARPDYANSVQGSVTLTDKPLDLAIAGQGFFTVSREISSVNGSGTFAPQQQYTRAGDFTLDRDGYLVNSSGGVLNGWLPDAKGVLDTSKVAPIQVGQAAFSPVATTQATLVANLPATPSSTASVANPLQVFDALGNSQTLQLTWTQQPAAAAGASTWTVKVALPNGTSLGTADVSFGTNGAPAGTISNVANIVPGTVTTPPGGTITAGSAYTAGSPATLTLKPDFGSGPQAITLNLGSFGQGNGLTQYAGTDFSLKGLTQDGAAPGTFSGVTTRQNGDIVANYDNGQSRTVARVPLTLFANPDALQRQDGQAFSATRDSGGARTLGSGSNGAGNLVTQSVEGSNVDIAAEFSKLIVAQRAYSANTKMVTTADELLQQTLDMKR